MYRSAQRQDLLWATADAAYEAEIAKARPIPGSRTHRREMTYPTAVVAAIAAWDAVLNPKAGA